NADGRAETGTVIDITSLNGQTVNAKLGDVIYIKLTGQANKGYQWSIASPTAADYLMLKDHKNSGLNDPNAAEGKFTDEWWLKVQNPGEFDLQFDYGQTKKPTTQTFKIKIITQ
ncbi:MAG: protease inhibitor I42 family protein, partial [Patescibacteria group bacterium]